MCTDDAAFATPPPPSPPPVACPVTPHPAGRPAGAGAGICTPQPQRDAGKPPPYPVVPPLPPPPGLQDSSNRPGLVPCFALLLRHPVPSRFSSPFCPPTPHIPPSGPDFMGRHGWVTRPQQLTGPGPAFSGTREAGGSDAAAAAAGGAGVVPGPFTPRPAGGRTGPEAAGFLTPLPRRWRGQWWQLLRQRDRSRQATLAAVALAEAEGHLHMRPHFLLLHPHPYRPVPHRSGALAPPDPDLQLLSRMSKHTETSGSVFNFHHSRNRSDPGSEI